MAIFKKRTTVVHHITYMGIMAAINLIFIILATYVPFLMFLPILFLPFVSTVVSYYCKKRFYIIYAVATVGLCLIFNISDTLFYVVPAIITGFIIGVLLDNKVNPFWLVLASSIIEAALTFALIPLINLIGNVDIVATFLEAFKLGEFVYKSELTYMFVYFLALLECAISHFILLTDARKIGIEINTGVASFAPYIIGLEAAILLSLTFAFFYAPLAFVFLLISIYFAVYLLIDIIASKKLVSFIVLLVLFTVAFFSFAVLYTHIGAPYGLLLILLFPLVMGITSFVNNYLLK